MRARVFARMFLGFGVSLLVSFRYECDGIDRISQTVLRMLKREKGCMCVRARKRESNGDRLRIVGGGGGASERAATKWARAAASAWRDGGKEARRERPAGRPTCGERAQNPRSLPTAAIAAAPAEPTSAAAARRLAPHARSSTRRQPVCTRAAAAGSGPSPAAPAAERRSRAASRPVRMAAVWAECGEHCGTRYRMNAGLLYSPNN